MAKKLIICNWKMNPASEKEAVLLAKKIEIAGSHNKNVSVAIAPPFPYISAVADVAKRVALGAQDLFWADVGPYTGEVSWRQLKNLGVKCVIVGHSERRSHLGETDDVVNKKILAALAAGLQTVLCIGERERQGNEIPAVVGEQLKKALAGVKKSQLKNLIVAYEPVWAISTNPGARPDTPDNAFRASVYIRKIISGFYGQAAAKSIRIIYGGSVNSKNIYSFLSGGGMQGALVGGASLNPKEFAEVLRQTNRLIP